MRLALLISLALCACDTPGPGFEGVTPVRMTVDGSTFDVRVRGKRAEVVRRNAEYAPRLGRMRGRAVFAMERASGCEVVRISGDAAQLRGDLDCGDGPPPRRPIGLSAEFSCLTLDGYISPATEELVLDLDCYPI